MKKILAFNWSAIILIFLLERGNKNKNMQQLRLGKITTRELASWFRLTYGSFKVKALKLYQTLGDYCQFERGKGFITVKSIKYPYYCKNIDVRDIETYHTMINMVPNKISSIKVMSEELDKRQLPRFQNISMRTIQHRMSEAGKIAYGITKDKQSMGVYGYRQYKWVIKTDRPWPNCYRQMTPIEYDLFVDLMKTYYNKNIDKVIEKEALEYRFRQDDTMTKDEYFDMIEKYNLDVFSGVIMKFMQRTGLLIVHATEHFDKPVS